MGGDCCVGESVSDSCARGYTSGVTRRTKVIVRDTLTPEERKKREAEIASHGDPVRIAAMRQGKVSK